MPRTDYRCCCLVLSAEECCEPCAAGRHNSCVGPLAPISYHDTLALENYDL